MKTNYHKSMSTATVLMLSLLGLTLVSSGCNYVQCAPALSCDRLAAADANYPDIWTSGKYNSFRVVAANGAYRVKDSALKNLQKVMAQQAGLDVKIIDGSDTGLPKSGKLSNHDVMAAGLAQVPDGNDPVVVIVVVNNLERSVKGFLTDDRFYLKKLAKKRNITLPKNMPDEDSFMAVLVLNRDKWFERMFEDIVLLHEIGHWLGVPARKFHIYCDEKHCTNGRCVMFMGKWSLETTTRLLLANLLTGPPKKFGSHCAEELTQIKNLRDNHK